MRSDLLQVLTAVAVAATVEAGQLYAPAPQVRGSCGCDGAGRTALRLRATGE